MSDRMEMGGEMEARERRCDGCAYYVAAKHYYGECHRHAPSPAVPVGEDDVYNTTSYWPEVQADDWCGEFEWSGKWQVKA